MAASDVSPEGQFWVSGGRDQSTKKFLDTIEYLEPKSKVWKASSFKLPKPDAGHQFKVFNSSHFIFVQSQLDQEEIDLING